MTVIEAGSFAENKLASIIIPANITFIEVGAFEDNQLTSITIGANVVLEPRANMSVFDIGFDDFYRKNGSKAGTYLVNWVHRP